MKNLFNKILITCCLVIIQPMMVLAADATAGIDFSTSYIFRGATVNDSYVAQPYMELSGFPKVEGLSIGTWGNLDLDDAEGGEPKSGQFSEVDLYLAYDLPLNHDMLGVSVGYTEYVYPSADVDADREFGLTISADTILNPYLSTFYGVDGAMDEQVYMEFGVGHVQELGSELALSLDAMGTYLFQPKDSLADDGFSYARLSATLSYAFLAATVNYYIETDDKVLVIDEDVQGVLGVSLDF